MLEAQDMPQVIWMRDDGNEGIEMTSKRDHTAHRYSIQHWIDAKEQKPNGETCVDLWGSILGGYSHGDESRLENCFYDHVKEQWWCWDEKCTVKLYLDHVDVTHWMHQPEPPK